MKDIDQSRTASILTLIAGIWIAASPIFIPVAGGLFVSMIILGAVIALAGLVQIFWENILPSWISGIAAVLLFIAAFITGTASAAAMWNMIISAIAVFALAVWDEVEIAHFIGENRRSQQH